MPNRKVLVDWSDVSCEGTQEISRAGESPISSSESTDVFYMYSFATKAVLPIYEQWFLAVQDSSIGDLVSE